MIDAKDHLGLIIKTVSILPTFYFEKYERDELISICYIYLTKSIEKFDENKGFKFSTFAINYMKLGLSSYYKRNCRWFTGHETHSIIPTSLQSKVKNSKENNITYEDLLSDDENKFINIENIDLLIAINEKLNTRERKVINLIYFKSLTFREVAPILGVTVTTVYKIKTRCLKKIAEAIEERRFSA